MSNNASLRLNLEDVHGNRLAEPVDIRLENLGVGGPLKVRGADASKRILIPNLRGQPEGTYRIEVDPPSYLAVRQFVNVAASGVTDYRLRFAVDAAKVDSVLFPSFASLPKEARDLLDASTQVLGFEGLGGAKLYDALDAIRGAGLLNIIAKSQHTRFEGGRSVLSYFDELLEVRGDRFFVRTSQALREQVKNSIDNGLFHGVNGQLHHPPDGFSSARSFKTDDAYGNLQLSFFAKPDEWRADVDIDDAGGLEHVFQVVRNTVTGRPTHPFNIHQILIAHQGLDPGYELTV